MNSFTLDSIAATAELRIDPHFFGLVSKISDLTNGIVRGYPIAQPFLLSIRNGENLAASLYVRDETESSTLYASVGAFSQFAFREGECIPLRSNDITMPEARVQVLKTTRDEVLLTRSGTPGIAWSPSFLPERSEEPSIIPSGFIIRLTCNKNYFQPGYLTAILNHPLWRLWTSGFAAGKRQRNLSQEHLWQIKIPHASQKIQRLITELYSDALNEINQIFEQPETIKPLCDLLLTDITNLRLPQHQKSIARVESNNLTDVCLSDVLRIDHRFLRSDFRKTYDYVKGFEGQPLRKYLKQALIRNNQPEISVEDLGEAPRVIATGALQFGQVVEQLTKPTSIEYFARVQERKVIVGDILIAMDGDGSIGKAAVMLDDYDAICDSHVSIARGPDLNRALAIACFINSTFGQSQIGRMISGATGQVQLSTDDLLGLYVPACVEEHADRIAARYRAQLKQFVSPVAKTREVICEASRKISKLLCDSQCFDLAATKLIRASTETDYLAKQLSRLRPKMF